jgi:hypothetical protein
MLPWIRWGVWVFHFFFTFYFHGYHLEWYVFVLASISSIINIVLSYLDVVYA